MAAIDLHHNEPNLDRLAERWLQEKELEDSCKRRRIELETEMLPLLSHRPEGQTSTKTNQGRQIVLKTKLNRTLDGVELNKIRDKIPADLLPLQAKEVLDLKRLRYLQNNEPETYRLLAGCITTKPAKPNITIATASPDSCKSD